MAVGAFGFTVLATVISWDHMASRRPFDLVVRAAGWAGIGIGAAVWARAPAVRLAQLLLAFGAALFLRDLRESDFRTVHDLGLATAFAWTGIGAHLALSWPDGRLRGRVPVALVAASYVCALGTQVMRLVRTGSGEFWPRAGSASAALLACVIGAVVVRRWWAGREHGAEDLVVAGTVVIGIVTVWVALLNYGDASTPRVDVVPVVVALSVVPVALLAYLRLHTQLRVVQASRRRLLEATQFERQRIQRDLHDGAQQGLAAAQILLWEAERTLPAIPDPQLELARQQLAEVRRQLRTSIEELRALVQGIYPAILRDEGLLPALEAVARRSPVPVVVDVPGRRWSHELEIAAYFCAQEALTNALKYAHASRVDISIRDGTDGLLIRVDDDGLGEARPPWDGGLQMLQDRVESAAGRLLEFRSEPGHGTSVALRLPHPRSGEVAPADRSGPAAEED